MQRSIARHCLGQMSAECTALNRTPVSLHPSSSGNSKEEEQKEGKSWKMAVSSVMCRLLDLMWMMLSRTHSSSGHLHKTPPISIPSLGRAHKAHFSQRDYRPMKASVTLQERALTMLLQAVLITCNGSPKMWQMKGDLRSAWWMGNEIRGNNERDTNQRGERKRDFKR